MAKRILFIGHEASRTGAPILLLNFLQWLKANSSGFDVDVLLLRGGELADQFGEISTTYVLPGRPDNPSFIWRGWSSLKRKIGITSRVPRVSPFFTDYDVVIGNTVLALEYLGTFQRRGIPTLCWIHELDFIVRSFFTDNRFKKLSENADQFIVVSKAVGDMLRGRGIQKQMHLVYGFPRLERSGKVDVGAIKGKLGIPADAFVVGASGTIEWRKGVDLFLQIAERTAAVSDKIHFVWVGGNSGDDDPYLRWIDHDFRRLLHSDRINFTGSVKDVEKYFAAFDVFALTSREDPFPLVALEAAALGKPVICFENAGGIPEFVETDAGWIIPYGDVEAFSRRLQDSARAPKVLAATGESARVKVSARFSQEIACRRLYTIISNI